MDAKGLNVWQTVDLKRGAIFKHIQNVPCFGWSKWQQNLLLNRQSNFHEVVDATTAVSSHGLALDHMLDSHTNPIIAPPQHHPHIHIGNFLVQKKQTNWKAKKSLTVKTNFWPPERATSRKLTEDVGITLSIFTLWHWAGEETGVLPCRHAVHTNRLPIPPAARILFFFAFFFFFSSFAMTWLDSVLELAVRTKREHSADLLRKHHGNNTLSLLRRCCSKLPPTPRPPTWIPPHTLLPLLFGILIRDQLTRLSTVSCSAPRPKLLVGVRHCNLSMWYFPICQGVAPCMCHPPRCSLPLGLLVSSSRVTRRSKAMILLFVPFCLSLLSKDGLATHPYYTACIRQVLLILQNPTMPERC